MAKYNVIAMHDATTAEYVEADTPEEAMENAETYASLCHQCSGQLDVGDVLGFIVEDDKGDTIHDDTDPTRDNLRAQLAAMTAERDEARRDGMLEGLRKAHRHALNIAEAHPVCIVECQTAIERDIAAAEKGTK